MDMDKNEKKSMLDDIPTAIAAGYYGVPKSLIAGYFISKFLSNKEDERKREEIETDLNELERRRGRTGDFLQALERYESVYDPRKKTNFIGASALQSASTFSQKSASEAFDTSNQNKKVSGMLGVGIFFMPYIFSWLTLRDGYGKNTKIVSFVWMIIVLLIVASDIAKKH